MQVFALILSTALALSSSGADAFVVQQPASASALRSSPSSLNTVKTSQVLSDIDLMAIENVAELCLNMDSIVEGCDLDEHEALVNTFTEQRAVLVEQRDILNAHVEYLDSTLVKLMGNELNGQSLSE